MAEGLEVAHDDYAPGRWDPELRLAKARKIEALLRSRCNLTDARILDVGTGSGIIAASLAKAVGPRGEVIGTDVRDQRQVRDGFEYVQVTDTVLPFDESSFDVVVTNHVIEHVGDRDAQLEHLLEIRRVLRPEGSFYLATPNRWTVMEPHFRLPFLSWLPSAAQTPYVRLFRRGSDYDCRLLTRPDLQRLFQLARLEWDDQTVDAMRVMAAVERPGLAARTILTAPEAFLRVVRGVIPTMVFLGRRSP
ncbi:MAG: methyltransferase domain-containing protein [Actinomycetota bacterium]|nr:methyltransferase domain-containing protein [Actinomycetota bacterium]